MQTIISGEWQGHLGRGLAPKELQYVMHVADGMTAKEIARIFGISPGTVKKRLDVAMFKLGVHRRAALVAEAMKRQIISPVCILLAALIAMHAAVDDHSMRRDRRAPERRSSQVRMVRAAEASSRYC
jgi:DNA-binding CsgD family transcriptional regulator